MRGYRWPPAEGYFARAGPTPTGACRHGCRRGRAYRAGRRGAPPCEDLLRAELPAAGNIGNTRSRQQHLRDNPRLLRGRPAAAPTRSCQQFDPPISRLRVIANFDHSLRSKPSASSKTTTSETASVEGPQRIAYRLPPGAGAERAGCCRDGLQLYTRSHREGTEVCRCAAGRDGASAGASHYTGAAG